MQKEQIQMHKTELLEQLMKKHLKQQQKEKQNKQNKQIVMYLN